MFKGSLASTVDWRIQTVKHLERFFPIDAASLAYEFEREFDFLVKDVRDKDHEDLVNIIAVSLSCLLTYGKAALQYTQQVYDQNPRRFSNLGDTRFPCQDCHHVRSYTVNVICTANSYQG